MIILCTDQAFSTKHKLHDKDSISSHQLAFMAVAPSFHLCMDVSLSGSNSPASKVLEHLCGISTSTSSGHLDRHVSSPSWQRDISRSVSILSPFLVSLPQTPSLVQAAYASSAVVLLFAEHPLPILVALLKVTLLQEGREPTASA